MVGETQVLGQFKAFLATLGHDQAWLGRLGQRLLGDAREIRTKYLQGLGSRSYGSAVRRHLSACRHAVLIGTGKLAQEVLPFLADEGRTVDHWGRREDAASSNAGVTYRTLDQIDDTVVSDAAVLIIAAPVPSDVIARVAARYTALQSVIDLRAELTSDPLDVAAPDRLAPGSVCADGRRERVRVAPRRGRPRGHRAPKPTVRVPRRAAPVRLGRPVRVRILSRASDLARLQAMLVSRALQAQFPELDIHLLTRASAGDRDDDDAARGDARQGRVHLGSLGRARSRATRTSSCIHGRICRSRIATARPWRRRSSAPIRATCCSSAATWSLGGRARITILSSSPRRAWLLEQALPELLPWRVDAFQFAPVRGNIADAARAAHRGPRRRARRREGRARSPARLRRAVRRGRARRARTP